MKFLNVNLNIHMEMEDNQKKQKAIDELYAILDDALGQYNNLTFSEFFEAEVVEEE